MAKLFLVVFLRVFFRFRVEGRENIPADRGFVLASNHCSNLDPMVLGAACGRTLNFMAKEDLFNNRFFGGLISAVGAFPIKRDASDVAAIREAIKRLRRGKGLVIFPQGARKQKKVLDVQPGIGMLAFRAKVPVVPTFISGSEEALPAGARCIRPAQIRVVFGKPLCFDKQKSYPEIAHEVMREINNLAGDVAG